MSTAARRCDKYQTHMYLLVNVDLSDPVEADVNLFFFKCFFLKTNTLILSYPDNLDMI